MSAEEDQSIFQEYIKPAVGFILTGIMFILWSAITDYMDADKEAKANLFSKWDEAKEIQYQECREDKLIAQQRVYDLTKQLIESRCD